MSTKTKTVANLLTIKRNSYLKHLVVLSMHQLGRRMRATTISCRVMMFTLNFEMRCMNASYVQTMFVEDSLCGTAKIVSGYCIYRVSRSGDPSVQRLNLVSNTLHTTVACTCTSNLLSFQLTHGRVQLAGLSIHIILLTFAFVGKPKTLKSILTTPLIAAKKFVENQENTDVLISMFWS